MLNIIVGDCLDVMKDMQENSIDFIVTDPPYGLNFMGKKWDKSIPNQDIWAEALRVCKPGSMLAAFGGSRTHHHLMMAIERAGWEIRDVIMWVYGQGFPKSHNKFGFDGYGTALKPAYEPIILAMKPLDGTFAQNAEKWGVAGINIDDNRIDGKKRSVGCLNPGTRSQGNSSWNTSSLGIRREVDLNKGRWPANIIFDEQSAKDLDDMTGILKSGCLNGQKRLENKIYGKCGNTLGKPLFHTGDSGGASRFFYCAKASSKERNRGLDGMPLKENPYAPMGINIDEGIINRGGNPKNQKRKQQNFHPTVKPISLMKYIIKLLAPPGSPVLLDPFCGSGSTLIAAKELGISSIGIEKEQEYCEIANKRIAHNPHI